ncbi:hypothetical protein Tco_0822144 [Tanacetum coccineum]|uniref:Uncharacterized protein n=1 Tax=Tanacetum coccineum TaxID=301880 RepID=A0ABQ5AEB7_9ASTR
MGGGAICLVLDVEGEYDFGKLARQVGKAHRKCCESGVAVAQAFLFCFWDSEEREVESGYATDAYGAGKVISTMVLRMTVCLAVFRAISAYIGEQSYVRKGQLDRIGVVFISVGWIYAVPIHHSSDKTIVGASALSLALNVYDARVWRIRENIVSHRSLFQDVFIPLAEPFSAAAITGTKGTSHAVPATADTTAALSVTFASANTVTPISIDDYEVTCTDDYAATNDNVADENANPFPNVDDAELNIPQ